MNSNGSYATGIYNGKYLLTQGEKVMLTIVGILVLLGGLITLAFGIVKVASEQEFILFNIYLLVYGVVVTVSGVFCLFKARWAFIAAEIMFVLDTFYVLNGIFAPTNMVNTLISFLLLAPCIIRIFFANKCQDCLSGFSQTSRKSYASKRT